MHGKTEPAGTSQNYQRFAWGTLALAAVVALAGTDRGDVSVAAPAVATTVGEASQVSPKIARPAFTVAEPQPEDIEPGDGAEAGEEAVEPPPGGPVLRDNQVPAAEPKGPAGPDAAQAGQMVSSSRDRSGGIAQGDDPLARRAD